ncbi:MAG: nitroreductase family protein [Acidimicrobiales bacterium]
MELADVIRRRRMVRSFSGVTPARRDIEQVLELALRAPTAGNTLGWDAVVLEGPEQTSCFWDATTTGEWRSSSRRWAGLKLAPVAVAVFANPNAYLQRYAEADKASSGLGSDSGAWPVPFWFFDAGLAVLLLLLAAADTGLGACFLGNFRGEDRLRQILGVPDDRRYVGAVLIGAPGDEAPRSASLRRPVRRPVDAFHRGRW